MHRVINLVAHPLHTLADFFVRHRKGTKADYRRHAARISVGTFFALFGAFLATHPAEWMPHFLWDAVAYGIHAVGMAPVLSYVGNILPIFEE